MKKTPDSEHALHFSAYTPYGYVVDSPQEQILLGFNGQLRDALTGLYALGNGHRCFNPALQRFQSADVMSPFDEGGINAYAYCGGDPINRLDPSGQSWMSPFKAFANKFFGRIRSRDRVQVPSARELYSAQLKGTMTPSFDQAISEDLLLPTYQFVEDNLPPKVQQRLAGIRERRRIIKADIKYLRYRPEEVPEQMKRELESLAKRSLRLRSRSASDLTQPINFSPNYSTAIVESAPPPQANRQVRRS